MASGDVKDWYESRSSPVYYVYRSMWTHVAVSNEMLIQHLSYRQDGRFEGGRQHFFSITIRMKSFLGI